LADRLDSYRERANYHDDVAAARILDTLGTSLERTGRKRPAEGVHVMRLSARNQIPARVTAINYGEAIANVELDADGIRLVASITVEAVQQLGLAVGSDVTAVIKASDVILAVADLLSSTVLAGSALAVGGEQVKEWPDPVPLLRGMAEQAVRVHAVPGATPRPGAGQIPRALQVSDDRLDRALGQFDGRGDIADPRLGVAGDLYEHVPVSGQQSPVALLIAHTPDHILMR
jgi:molybdopterin-binding protein